MNEQNFYVYFWIFQFLLSNLHYHLLILLNKTLFLYNLHWQKSNFHAFIFDLNLSRDLVFLYLLCRIAQVNGPWYRTVRMPYLMAFLSSVKIFLKLLMLCFLQRNWKTEFIIGSTIPLIILHTFVNKP